MSAGPTPAEEDRLTMPAAWLHALYPRRGGTPVAVKPPDESAPRELAARLDAHRAPIRDSLAECPDPELASAGQAYLAGTATPLGAAAVATAAASSVPWSHRAGLLPLFAEAWLAGHGLLFAAAAVTEAASLGTGDGYPQPPIQRLADDATPGYWYDGGRVELAARVRAVLATAPDAEYAEVVAALAKSRESGLRQRVMTSFLAPTETGWVAADCAEVSRVNPHL